MKQLLVIDDEPASLLRAREVAESLGFDVHGQTSVRSAQHYLEKIMDSNLPLPDAIVLDLDFGMDSGLELLRFWHSTPSLSQVPILVWSILEEQKRICELFRVNSFVSKAEGLGALRQALGQLL